MGKQGETAESTVNESTFNRGIHQCWCHSGSEWICFETKQTPTFTHKRRDRQKEDPETSGISSVVSPHTNRTTNERRGENKWHRFNQSFFPSNPTQTSRSLT